MGLLLTLQVEAANEERAAAPEGDLRSHKATTSYQKSPRYNDFERDRRLPEVEVANSLLPIGLSFTTALPPTAILQAVDPQTRRTVELVNSARKLVKDTSLQMRIALLEDAIAIWCKRSAWRHAVSESA